MKGSNVSSCNLTWISSLCQNKFQSSQRKIPNWTAGTLHFFLSCLFCSVLFSRVCACQTYLNLNKWQDVQTTNNSTQRNRRTVAIIAATLTGLSLCKRLLHVWWKTLSLRVMKCLSKIWNLKIKLLRKIISTWHTSALQYCCQVISKPASGSLMNTESKRCLVPVGTLWNSEI